MDRWTPKTSPRYSHNYSLPPVNDKSTSLWESTDDLFIDMTPSDKNSSSSDGVTLPGYSDSSENSSFYMHTSSVSDDAPSELDKAICFDKSELDFTVSDCEPATPEKRSFLQISDFSPISSSSDSEFKTTYAGSTPYTSRPNAIGREEVYYEETMYRKTLNSQVPCLDCSRHYIKSPKRLNFSNRKSSKRYNDENEGQSKYSSKISRPLQRQPLQQIQNAPFVYDSQCHFSCSNDSHVCECGLNCGRDSIENRLRKTALYLNHRAKEEPSDNFQFMGHI
ncbi:unnamed protein product [Dimorphilus gyrociliatus]|uniref:Uncharacterized protein n=1 Tax=Dimorphilus gyrociliatus TaxID=2664684 RepID=A0A7I8VVQ8_9ANNE|nr:unnamed protein product [Dimorphilus gyrociliatus]